jgi:hypothetical protein
MVKSLMRARVKDGRSILLTSETGHGYRLVGYLLRHITKRLLLKLPEGSRDGRKARAESVSARSIAPHVLEYTKVLFSVYEARYFITAPSFHSTPFVHSSPQPNVLAAGSGHASDYAVLFRRRPEPTISVRGTVEREKRNLLFRQIL